MATSGYKSITVTSYDTLRFSWEITSQSIANNTSVVAWKMELIAGSSGKITSNVSKTWSVTVNGTSYSGTNNIGIGNNETKTLASGTTTIKHNGDGTKTFSYSFTQQFKGLVFSGVSITDKSGSGTGTLDPIHQTSGLSASNGTLGTAQTLTVNRQSSSLTHTITYKCGSASGTVCTKSSSTSISFTPPLSLASQNTTGTNVSVVFTMTTYSGSTSVGSCTKTISCAIPSSVKPTVTVAVSDTTGHSTTYGGYLQGMSKLKIVVTASGSYGSTIKAYKTTADGKTYTTASVTTDAISGSGTLTINATVTDSRGRTGTVSTSISVIKYAVPKVTTIVTKRCDETGVSSSNGAYMMVEFTTVIAPINDQNTAAYVLQYKKVTDTTFTEVALDDYTGQYSVNNGTYMFPAATDSTYEVVILATDALNSTMRSTSGASVSKLFSWMRRGLGFAFGKVAELEGVLDIAFKARFLGGILPIVLANGTDFNDVTTPGWYIGNASTGQYTNCPLTSGTFTLEVMSAGEVGQLYQNLDYCSKTDYTAYRRFYYQTEWGSWIDPHSTIPVDVQVDIDGVRSTANNALSKADTNATNISKIQTDVNTLKGNVTDLQAAVNDVLLSVYPVGSIYMSMNSTSPATLFGGTWEQIQDKFLLASGAQTSGATGGSTSHQHVVPVGTRGSNTAATIAPNYGTTTGNSVSGNKAAFSVANNTSSYSDIIFPKTSSTNHLPPFVAVNVWKRTA